jgi:pyridoxal phosphate enzyme (YggS family)
MPCRQFTRSAGIFPPAAAILAGMPDRTLAATIAANLAGLHERIAQAAIQAGRRPQDVRLIAVSKTQPPEAVAAAVAAGQRAFGENTVQDALSKIPRFAGQGLEWHFIGHLQSNKAKHIPGHFAWLHSLDSFKLAQRLARLAAEQGVALQCLIEVNITRDPAKQGVTPEALPALLEALLKENLAGLRLRGLMAIGPHPASADQSRAAFAALRRLRDEVAARFALAEFTELSMGMSDDYLEAIQEGATLVRLGTAVFGERAYPAPR